MAPARKRWAPLTRPKTAKELANIKRAIDVTDRIFRELDNPFGRSERDVAREIRARAKRLGAGLAFQPIIASGRNAGYVHHKPGQKIVREYEPVIFDIGFKVGGQCTDVTRMHMPKAKGGKKFRRFYRDALEMQRKCIGKAVAGRSLKGINELYKKLMKRKGYKVKHSIGHGVGSRVHERVKGPLKPGMVITIEPGVYERKKYGLRVEDMVLVTRGRPKILTRKIKFTGGFKK